MAAVEYNTVPEESPLLVAEAPKKKPGRLVAAVAASLILATAVAGTAPSVFRVASNMAKSGGKTTCLAVGCDYFDHFDLYSKNMEPQVTFKMMPYESWFGEWQGPPGPKDPCMGALARTNAKGASLKAGKQYNAGSIRVVDCAKDVSPQYQLTEWLQV